MKTWLLLCLVLSHLIGPFQTVLAIDPPPLKKPVLIPSHHPKETLKVGDVVRVTVKIKNPSALGENNDFEWGGQGVTLSVDPKAGNLVGEFEILPINRSNPEVTLTLASKDERSEISGVPSQKDKRSETKVETDYYFESPVFPAVATDDAGPKLSNVVIRKIDATHFELAFDSEDATGTAQFGYILGSKWDDNPAEKIKAGNGLFSFQTQVHVPIFELGKKETVKARIEAPETIIGTPHLALQVWDLLGNESALSSDQKGFTFEWPHRFPRLSDLGGKTDIMPKEFYEAKAAAQEASRQVAAKPAEKPEVDSIQLEIVVKP